jgi:PASTA domain
VPATKGRTEAEARALLGDAGFTVGQIVPGVSNDLPTGTVKETSPAELTEAPTNVPVVVIVSLGLASSPGFPSSSGPSLSLGPPSSGPPSPPPPGLPVPLPSKKPLPPPPTPPSPTPTPPDRTCPPASSDDQPPAGLAITSPGPGAWLGEVNESHGTARLASGGHLWLLLCAPGIHYFYFVSETHRETPVSNGAWQERIYLNPNEHGDFFLYAVVVDAEDSQRLDKSSADGGDSQFVTELPQSARYSRVVVHCCS